MKKLLALILCVMMFVAIIPTAAFADPAPVRAHADQTTLPLTPIPSAAKSADLIKKAKENIDYMYNTLAADNAVFSTIQSMDSIVGSLATNLFDGVDTITDLKTGLTITGSKAKDNTKVILRDVLGSAIVKYMDDHRSDFESRSVSVKAGTNSLSYTGKLDGYNNPLYVDAKTGKIYGYDKATDKWFTPKNASLKLTDIVGAKVEWDPDATVKVSSTYKYNPEKYLKTFTDAVTDAFNGKDGASYLQNTVYQLAALKVLHDTREDLKDLHDAIVDWEDGTAILNQYHFHDVFPNGEGAGEFNPYAMLDLGDYPNSISVPAAIFAP